MEEKFAAAWEKNREKAAALGVRIREQPQALSAAKRSLSGNRLSDGFNRLQELGHLELTMEALVVDSRFTGLFTDDEANEALSRLLEAGYRFR